MINSFQHVEIEHREQRESHFQREDHAWSPIAQEAYSREGRAMFKEHCQHGHHRGHHNSAAQYLPDMEIGGPLEPPTPNFPTPQQNPYQQRECSPAPQSSSAADMAKLDKTIKEFASLIGRAIEGVRDASITPPTNTATTSDATIATGADSATEIRSQDQTQPDATPTAQNNPTPDSRNNDSHLVAAATLLPQQPSVID